MSRWSTGQLNKDWIANVTSPNNALCMSPFVSLHLLDALMKSHLLHQRKTNALCKGIPKICDLSFLLMENLTDS